MIRRAGQESCLAAHSRRGSGFQAEKQAAWDSGRLFWRQMRFRKSHAISAMAAVSCLAPLFTIRTLWAQETQEKVTVDDVDRSFTVRLPKGYDPQQHYPVVILLHGINQDPSDMERLTRFNELTHKSAVIA